MWMGALLPFTFTRYQIPDAKDGNSGVRRLEAEIRRVGLITDYLLLITSAKWEGLPCPD
jgi:hypothetical protein